MAKTRCPHCGCMSEVEIQFADQLKLCFVLCRTETCRRVIGIIDNAGRDVTQRLEGKQRGSVTTMIERLTPRERKLLWAAW